MSLAKTVVKSMAFAGVSGPLYDGLAFFLRYTGWETQLAGNPFAPKGLSEGQTNKDAREDAREQAYDDNGNVQPSEPRLVEVSRGRTFMRGLELILVRAFGAFDRGGSS
jgi:hypothetical protein